MAARRGGGTVSAGDGSPASPAVEVPAPETLAPGDVVDGIYRVERLLGEGGNGAVFLVKNLELGGARFALKVVHAADERGAEALAREGRLAAQVGSAHVVKVSALGRLPRGSRYLVMEYVEGPTLDRLIAERALTAAEVIDCGRQLCLALEAVHGQDLIHGDVSLRNVFATAQPDGRLHLQLGDFGLVRRTRRHGAGTVSVQLETVHGTPRFMAPEVISDDDVDERADVFAVGVVLYRLLADAFPFDGETNREIFTATLRGQPAPLPARAGGGGALAAVVMRCLEHDPAARFAGARELRLALEETAGARTAPPPERAAPARARVATASERTAPMNGPARSAPAVAPVTQAAPPSTRRRWAALAGIAATGAIVTAVIVAQRDGTAARAAEVAPPVDASSDPFTTAAPSISPRGAKPRVRVVRFAVEGDTCLAVRRDGVTAALGAARCDRERDPPDQLWTITPVSDPRDDQAVELRGPGGLCVSWDRAPYVAACDPSSTSATRFAIRKRVTVGGNVWNLVAVGTERRLCVVASGAATVGLAEGSDCDRWNEKLIWRIEEVVPLERTTTVTVGGRCVSVVDGAAHSADFGVIELRRCDATELDQRWQLMPVIEDGAPTAYVQLRNAWKGLCLEVGDVDQHGAGSSVGIYMCDGGGLPNHDSHWKVVSLEAGGRRLENRVSRLYATALGARDGDRFVVDQLDRDTDRQTFTATDTFWTGSP